MMIVDTADDLGVVGLDIPQREHSHSQKYDQKLGQTSRSEDLSGQTCPGRVPAVAGHLPVHKLQKEAGSLFGTGL
jgi:hypothetical protein